LNEIWRGAVRRHGQEDYARNAHASKLMEACWRGRKV
jgi:hypothetical protein